MSRFKELRRIQAAIKHKDKPELAWALWYCQMRLSLASRKDHYRYWQQRKHAVSQALEEQT